MASATKQWAALHLKHQLRQASTPEERAAIHRQIERAKIDPSYRRKLAEAGEHGRWSSGPAMAAKLGLAAGSFVPGVNLVAAPALAALAVPTAMESYGRAQSGLPWGLQAAESAVDLLLPAVGRGGISLLRGLRGSKAAEQAPRLVTDTGRVNEQGKKILRGQYQTGAASPLDPSVTAVKRAKARADAEKEFNQAFEEEFLSGTPRRDIGVVPLNEREFRTGYGTIKTEDGLFRDPWVDLHPDLAKFAQEGAAGLQPRSRAASSLSEGIRRRRVAERPSLSLRIQRPSRLVRPQIQNDDLRGTAEDFLVAQKGRATPGTITLPHNTVEQVRRAFNEPLSFAIGAGKSARKVPGQTLGNEQWRYNPRLEGWVRQGRGHTLGGRGPGGAVGALESSSFIHNEAIEALAKQRGISLQEAGDILMTKVDIPGTTTVSPAAIQGAAAEQAVEAAKRAPLATRMRLPAIQTAEQAAGAPVRTSVPPVDDAIDDARQVLDEVGGGTNHTADEFVDSATGAVIDLKKRTQDIDGTSVSNLIDLAEQGTPSGPDAPIMAAGVRAAMSWVRRVLPRIAEDEQQLILKGGEEGEHILKREFWRAGGLRAKTEDLKKGERGGSSSAYLHASRGRGTGRSQHKFTLLEEGRPADKVVDFFLQVEKLDKAGNVVKFGNRTVAEATAVKSALQDLIADNINKGTISPNLRRLYQQNLDGSPILNKKGRPKLSPTFLRGKKGEEAYKDLTIKQRQEIEINEQYRKRAEAFLTEVFRTEALARVARLASGAGNAAARPTVRKLEEKLFPDIRGSLFKFLGGESTLSAKQIKQQNVILEEIRNFEGSIASFLGAILGAEQLMRQEMPIGTTG